MKFDKQPRLISNTPLRHIDKIQTDLALWGTTFHLYFHHLVKFTYPNKPRFIPLRRVSVSGWFGSDVTCYTSKLHFTSKISMYYCPVCIENPVVYMSLSLTITVSSTYPKSDVLSLRMKLTPRSSSCDQCSWASTRTENNFQLVCRQQS